ncbi:MAG: LPS export ABC transporter periplasmic protein LptC [Aquificae bacterium]|nr:LPS export ABC transporter periplasmic protein LptC [Aquificota bacterium]
MGLQESQGKEQKEILKKVFFFSILVFIGAFLFSQIEESYYKSKIGLLRLGKSQIEDFLIVGKNEDKFIIKGNLLVDEGTMININEFVLSYIRNNFDVLNINSHRAIFFKEKKLLSLQENVNFISNSFIISTSKINIFLEEKIAKTDEKVIISSNNFLTEGENLLINFKSEELKLENVKSTIRGIL